VRFLGISGSGKTRATQTLGDICYRPLWIGGTASTASLYRQIEATGGTLLVDEGDFQNSQVGSDIVKILNNGYQRGFPVVRAASLDDDWVPRPYTVFGPKIINGRRRFRDDATESRCLVYTPQQTGRSDIPRQLPASFYAEAMRIQNSALDFRLETLDTFQPKELLVPDLRPRTNEILMPLLSVAELLKDPERERYKTDLISYARTLDNEAAQDNRDSVEGMLVNAYVRRCAKPGSQPTCGNLVSDLQGEDESLKHWLNPRKATEMLKALGFKTRHTKRGAEVNIGPGCLALLCERYSVQTAP
jgi:hypothetical protein